MAQNEKNIFSELGYRKERALGLLHDIMVYHAMQAIEDGADKDSQALEEIGFLQNFYTLLEKSEDKDYAAAGLPR